MNESSVLSSFLFPLLQVPLEFQYYHICTLMLHSNHTPQCYTYLSYYWEGVNILVQNCTLTWKQENTNHWKLFLRISSSTKFINTIWKAYCCIPISRNCLELVFILCDSPLQLWYLENAPTLNETWTSQCNEENASTIPKNTFIRSFIVLVNTMSKYRCVAVLYYLLSTDRIHLLAIFCLATKQRLRFIGRVNKPLGRKGH